MHSDWYNIFAGYWWLIFPILALVWGLADLLARHRRATHGLDMIKSYIDQGKEPPAEILALVRPNPPKQDSGNPPPYFLYFWGPAFFFVALSAGFAFLAFGGMGGGRDSFLGLAFVSVLMGGFAVALFLIGWIALYTDKRSPPP